MKELPLGKSTNYPISYDSNLLVAMNRLDSRRKLDFEDSVYTMYGIDAWTSYELSWLDLESIPKNGILYNSFFPTNTNGFLQVINIRKTSIWLE